MAQDDAFSSGSTGLESCEEVADSQLPRASREFDGAGMGVIFVWFRRVSELREEADLIPR